MVSYRPRGRLPCDAAVSQLFLSQENSDISLHVCWRGEVWHMPAHRLLLSSSSPVFKSMFETDMQEKKDGIVVIVDSSPRAVKGLLRFIYLGDTHLTYWTEALDLLKLGHKYHISNLVTICEGHLTRSLNLKNVCALHEAAKLFTLHQLHKKTRALILGAAFVLLQTEEFLELELETVKDIIEARELNVESELHVLSAVREWAINRCCRSGLQLTSVNIKRSMSEFNQLIRWTKIPEEEIELENELQARISFKISKEVKLYSSSVMFLIGSCADNLNEDWIECVKFQIDTPTFVVGCKIQGLFMNPNTNRFSAPESVSLVKEDDGRYTPFNLNSVLWKERSIVCDHVWRELTAYLPFPVRVEALSRYIIKLKNAPVDRRYRAKWPCNRLVSGEVETSLGIINFHCCSEVYAITELLFLPAV